MPDNGYTKIPNNILGALFNCSRISGQELQILLFIIRKTIGWNKISVELSLDSFVNATKIRKQNICRTIKKLRLKNMIFVIKNDNRTHSTYQFNSEYNKWTAVIKNDNRTKINYQFNSKCNNREALPNKKKTSIVIKFDNQSLSNLIIAPLKENKRKEKKDKRKEKKILIEKCFDRFYSVYPKKVGKKQARITWEKLTLKKELPQMNILIQAVREQMKSSQWQNKQFIPNPSTWLNNAAWDDEIIIDKPKLITEPRECKRPNSMYENKNPLTFTTSEREEHKNV